MIVLDEQLAAADISEAIRRWGGAVLNVKDLHPEMGPADDAIPRKLRSVKGCVFVTMNEADFWRRVGGDMHYAIVCFPLPTQRLSEIPELLRRLFRVDGLQTQAQRCGKVIRVSREGIQHYERVSARPVGLRWPETEG